jgi:methyl-accepting chemotaxis protein
MSIRTAYRSFRLRGQLIVTMTMAGGIPLAISAIVAQHIGESALTEAAGSKVEAIRSAKGRQIEATFAQIRGQAISLTEDTMVIDGAAELVESFHQIGAGLKPAEVDAARQQVAAFYGESFGPKLRENPEARPADVATLVPADLAGVVAQQRFIVENPNPLGKKQILDTAGSDSYAAVHARLHPILRSYLDRFGYYDVFVIDAASGDVVYTVFKETDFAQRLRPETQADDGLVRSFLAAKSLPPLKAHFEDFAPYRPSYDGPAAFVSTPIYRRGVLIAVLAMQMPVDRINDILNDAVGLGTTGESYLVAADGRMRSQSRLTKETTIFRRQLSTSSVAASARGESGTGHYPGPNTEDVLGAWAPVKIDGLNWSIIVEIEEQEALASAVMLSRILWGVLVVSLMALVFVAWRFSSRLATRVGGAVTIASAVARGDFSNDIVLDGHDEVGDLLEALLLMKTELFGRMLAEKNDALRIREGLENAAANVVVAGPDGTIVFANRAMRDLVARCGEDLRAGLPRFRGTLVGAPLQDLDVNTASASEQERKLGRRTFCIVANPIVAEDGTRVGSVVEWRDLTEEVDAATQVEELIEAASAGVLDRRLDPERFNGFMRRIGAGMNQMLDALVAPLTVTAHNLERLSRGDVPAPITTVYRGAFEKLRNNVNSCSAAVRLLVEDAESLSQSAVAGDLHARAALERHDGDFRRVMNGVNGTLDALVGPIEETKRVLGMLADGDLTGRVKGDFVGEYADLKEAANRSAENLQALATEIRSVSSVITSASNEIADGNASLSDRTQQEAASLEETWASVRDLTTTVQHNATSAREARRIAAESSTRAEEGRTIVGNAVEAMRAIERSSSRIDEIIGVIDEIAFQTNLLALNASVEAARAGEQGRGFAVVAAEVRNLAQRSATAAREIKGLIAESSSRVADGARLVNASGETLTGIVGSVRGVADLIAKISDAGEEQAAGIVQLQRSIEDLESSVQQNAALVEEVSAASNSLREQAVHLNTQVAAFKTEEGGPVVEEQGRRRRRRRPRAAVEAIAAE